MFKGFFPQIIKPHNNMKCFQSFIRTESGRIFIWIKTMHNIEYGLFDSGRRRAGLPKFVKYGTNKQILC